MTWLESINKAKETGTFTNGEISEALQIGGLFSRAVLKTDIVQVEILLRAMKNRQWHEGV